MCKVYIFVRECKNARILCPQCEAKTSRHGYCPATGRVKISHSGSAMSETRTDYYGYNERGELMFSRPDAEKAENEFAYTYDDIGNRLTSLDFGTNRVYVANNMNQYASISSRGSSASLSDEFVPQFDDDGNQTLIKTSTGIWQVQYNGENRPVRWESESTNIVMSFDRMGRRVTKNGLRFIYDGYLQISDSAGNSYMWDPTELVATRPLVGNFSTSYYTHDGNKNVSDLISSDGEIAAHYEYVPFGAVVAQCGGSCIISNWRFSSEFTADDTATIYYNYRHYEATLGRWFCWDPKKSGKNIHVLVDNNASALTDYLGREFIVTNHVVGLFPPGGWNDNTAKTIMTKLVDIAITPTEVGCQNGCYKFNVIFPKIRVDIYYEDDYARIQSYPMEWIMSIATRNGITS